MSDKSAFDPAPAHRFFAAECFNRAWDLIDKAERTAAYDLLRASLSARGYSTARDIMKLNHHLAELVQNFEEYGEHLYFFTIMGTPSATEPWGWQIDGHHLVVNYFVLGDQVVEQRARALGRQVFAGDDPRRQGACRHGALLRAVTDRRATRAVGLRP